MAKKDKKSEYSNNVNDMIEKAQDCRVNTKGKSRDKRVLALKVSDDELRLVKVDKNNDIVLSLIPSDSIFVGKKLVKREPVGRAFLVSDKFLHKGEIKRRILGVSKKRRLGIDRKYTALKVCDSETKIVFVTDAEIGWGDIVFDEYKGAVLVDNKGLIEKAGRGSHFEISEAILEDGVEKRFVLSLVSVHTVLFKAGVSRLF